MYHTTRFNVVLQLPALKLLGRLRWVINYYVFFKGIEIAGRCSLDHPSAASSTVLQTSLSHQTWRWRRPEVPNLYRGFRVKIGCREIQGGCLSASFKMVEVQVLARLESSGEKINVWGCSGFLGSGTQGLNRGFDVQGSPRSMRASVPARMKFRHLRTPPPTHTGKHSMRFGPRSTCNAHLVTGHASSQLLFG